MNTTDQLVRRDVVRAIDGTVLSIGDLPTGRNVRWTIRNKANLLLAIDGGVIGLDDAIARYVLSIEEIEGWRRDVASHGVEGLKATTLKSRRGV